jgi:hypothetical protein
VTSEKQISANRRNAARSTGPRTTAGKKRAAANALRHGLVARSAHGWDRSEAVDKLFRVLRAAVPNTELEPLLRELAETEIEILWVRATWVSMFNSVGQSESTYVPKNWASQSLRLLRQHDGNDYVPDPLVQLLDSWMYPKIPPESARAPHVFKIAGAQLASLNRYEDRALGRRGNILRSLQKLGDKEV